MEKRGQKEGGEMSPGPSKKLKSAKELLKLFNSDRNAKVQIVASKTAVSRYIRFVDGSGRGRGMFREQDLAALFRDGIATAENLNAKLRRDKPSAEKRSVGSEMVAKRYAKMTAEERSAAARNAAMKRWAAVKKKAPRKKAAK
jgi:hypothetical protein